MKKEYKRIRNILIKPEEGKCFQNNYGHKFLYKDGRALPMVVEDTPEAIEKFNQRYIQVNIK